METITIKRTIKGVWMKKFDDFENKFTRISEKQALEDINNARKKGVMFSDDNECKKHLPLIFAYQN